MHHDTSIHTTTKVCHVIDVGQAVDIGHPKAREFLRRDLSVVDSFFQRKGMSGRLLDLALAERFVVDFRGPSSSSSSTSSSSSFSGEVNAATAAGSGDNSGPTCCGGGGGPVVADGGEERPLAGVEVVLEVRIRPLFFPFVSLFLERKVDDGCRDVMITV